MLKFGVFSSLYGKMPKIDENREKRCTFVPVNKQCFLGHKK